MKSSDYLIYFCSIHKDKLTSTFLKKNEYIICSTSGGLSQELCSTQKSNWWAAQWPVRSSLPSDIEGNAPGECVDDMVALRNRSQEAGTSSDQWHVIWGASECGGSPALRVQGDCSVISWLWVPPALSLSPCGAQQRVLFIRERPGCVPAPAL